MQFEIKNLSGRVLATVQHNYQGVVVPPGTDLRQADFRGITLKTDIVTRDYIDGRIGDCLHISVWRLDGVDLSGADFSDSDIRQATFVNSNLTGATFVGARLNWCSHDVLAEILKQAAATEPHRLEAAATVLANRDWSWAEFVEFNGPHHNWCMNVLGPFVRPDDSVPPCLATPGVETIAQG